jgi:hypothetical protein
LPTFTILKQGITGNPSLGVNLKQFKVVSDNLLDRLLIIYMTADLQHLFNSSGSWIAFRKGKFVFDSNCNWIGWLPWNDGDIIDIRGQYLGSIFDPVNISV